MSPRHPTGAAAGPLHGDAPLGWALLRLVLLKILILSCLWVVFFQGRSVGVDALATARHLTGEAASTAAPASVTVKGAHDAR